MGKQIAFVIGHHVNKQGAYSHHLDSNEWPFFKKLCDDHLKNIGDVFSHDPLIFSYTKRQESMARKTADYDLVIELHFDMFNGSAGGCHAMHWHSNDRAGKVATRICNLFESRMGIVNRGNVKVYDASRNGAGFIIKQKAPAILLECFFGDNESDVDKFNFSSVEQVFNEINRDLWGLL